MPVPFRYFITVVNFLRNCAMHDLRWPRTKPHTPALVANAALLFEQRNDRFRCILVELGAVCICYPADVSGEFNRRHLHAETKTEIWNLMLARETCSIDFSLYAANAKATWNQNAGNILQSPIHAVLQQFSIEDRKSTRLNSSHTVISYAVFCLKNK